jgi:hypothetical protein
MIQGYRLICRALTEPPGHRQMLRQFGISLDPSVFACPWRAREVTDVCSRASCSVTRRVILASEILFERTLDGSCLIQIIQKANVLPPIPVKRERWFTARSQ